MFCSLCKKYNMKAKNGSGAWVTTPCTHLVKDSLIRHQKTGMHKDATDLSRHHTPGCLHCL